MPDTTNARALEALSDYKRLLQSLLDRRPSGTRGRLATALGTHKSFVSQIANPAYKVPLPAQHIDTLFRVCRFTASERQHFLELYAMAHPKARPSSEPENRSIRIDLPTFADPETAAQVEDAIRDHARRIIALASKRPPGP